MNRDAFEATGNEEPCVEHDASHSCEDSDNSAVHMPLFALPSDFGILKKFLTHLSWLMVLNLTIKPAYLLVVDAKIKMPWGRRLGKFLPAAEPSILLNILLDAGSQPPTGQSRRIPKV